MPLKKTDARFMHDGPKAVWSIAYVSVAFFPSLKQNFIAYRSSKVSDCIFEIHQLWQSGFRRMYSNCCCSCSFEAEILKIGQSSHKMYSNNILNFQESMTILNAHTKKCLETYCMHLIYAICAHTYPYRYTCPYIHTYMLSILTHTHTDTLALTYTYIYAKYTHTYPYRYTCPYIYIHIC